MFGLTGAPATQPRNAIVGQALSISIALAINYIDSLDPWIKQSLGTALAVGAMVKLGVTHPPAGGAAIVFSSSRMSWINMAYMLAGNVIAIASCTFINNLSDKRQYPTFWGLRPIVDPLWHIWGKDEESIAKN